MWSISTSDLSRMQFEIFLFPPPPSTFPLSTSRTVWSFLPATFFHVWPGQIEAALSSCLPVLLFISRAPPPSPPPRNVAANLSLQPVPPHRRGILRVQGKGNVSLPALGTLQSVNRGLPPAACGAPLENYIRPIIQHACYDFLQQTRGCWMGVRGDGECVFNGKCFSFRFSFKGKTTAWCEIQSCAQALQNLSHFKCIIWPQDLPENHIFNRAEINLLWNKLLILKAATDMMTKKGLHGNITEVFERPIDQTICQ